MIYIGIAFIAIFAGIICHGIDKAKRDRGESDCSGEPWNWEGWF